MSASCSTLRVSFLGELSKPRTKLVAASTFLLSLVICVTSWAIDRKRKNRKGSKPWAHKKQQCFYPFAPPKGIMNIRRQDEEPSWLDVDRTYCQTMELKMLLLTSRPEEVTASINDALCEIAGAEALNCIISDLQTWFPGLVQTTGSQICNLVTGRSFERGVGLDALSIAAQLVQEDLIVMIPQGRTFVLAMGVVCFADRWQLTEKLGLSLADIHGPVEQYAPIAQVVEQFFHSLRKHVVRVRYNYAFQNCSSLYLPEDCDVEACDQATYLRVERQGLRALPCGAVLFSIRTYLSLVSDIPRNLHVPLLEALDGTTKTSIGRYQRKTYADRVRQQLL